MREAISSSGVLLLVRYDGYLFSGFARQPGARTIQGELDGAVKALDPKASLVRGTSRTDARVHARCHPVAFDTTTSIPARGWVHGVNRHLPSEIAIQSATKVQPGFEPRARAQAKTYKYVIATCRVRDPFFVRRAWQVTDRLNQTKMTQAAAALVGEHDFRAFRTAADQRENTVRQVFRVEVRSQGSDSHLIEVLVTGNGFLHKMVRIIVGSLVDIGRQRLRTSAIADALSSGRRSDLGVTAPPEGLYLEHVELAEPAGSRDAAVDTWP